MVRNNNIDFWNLRKMDGYNTPPMYGDYEAQRHWMELTLHVPINQWYYYDLEWWGLDYPPLTAYVSWLYQSRGYESENNKLFMRSSVLILELLIYVPSVFVFVNWWFDDNSWKKKELATLLILLQPSLILIDHGHFHFKQMALYFAPAIFAYLLGKYSFENLSQVVTRIFPLQRGLYEDKVANIWCAINIIIKLREMFDIQSLVRLSMFPLLKKDHLVLPYLVLLFMWNWLGSFTQQKSKLPVLNYLFMGSYLVIAIIHIMEFKLSPPERYPDIYIVMNVIFSAGMFIISLIYFNYRQIISNNNSSIIVDRKEVEIEVQETEFNPQFLRNMIRKLEWNALLNSAKEINITTLPEVLPDDLDEDFLRNLHRVLLETHIQQGKMTCPNCNHVYMVRDGIPNMLLNENET
ncbi:955_t:CDS:10 [Diversispora eburnea]|uniref:Alpha-1,3-glucosyltransferase n=1 Tax=Diversispora eburnea TaxID=1213867 RepID=A0A9N9AXZ1_9GLOM|nr:955_t:CDS:10 [Diversispora eburnea]